MNMVHAPEYIPPILPPKPKATKAFALSIVSGILTILAGVAATVLTFFYPAFVPAWLMPYRLLGLGIGLILGIIILLGAFLIWHDSLGFGGAIVFLASMANLYLIVLWWVPVIFSYVVMVLGLLAIIFGFIGGIMGVFGK
jgi:hypothetical protein